MSKNTQNAFTLIELLVVIAIISIIAAILFPVFAKAREKARQTTCTSNERQLSLAFLQYSEDFDEVLPCGQTTISNSGWAGQIFSYVKDSNVFHCPDDPTGAHQRTISASGRTYLCTPVSYAVNANLTSALNPNYQSGYGIAGSLSAMTSPSRTIQLYEIGSPNHPAFPVYDVADLSTADEVGGGLDNSSGWSYSAGGTGQVAYNGGATSGLPQNTGYMGGSANNRSAQFTPQFYAGPLGRHTDGSNFLFCDGHVKWLRGESVSTGYVYNTKAVGCTPTSPKDTQDANYTPNCGNTAAGTDAPDGWAATFSPI